MDRPPDRDLDAAGQSQLFQVEGRFERYEAPTIPVDIIEQLNEVEPDLGTDIARLTIDEATHRRKLESEDLKQTHRNVRRGQWQAFGFTAGALVLSGYAVSQGQEAAGVLVGVSSIASVMITSWRRKS